MNTKIRNQIDLQAEIQEHGFNLVTCGRCGDPFLHRTSEVTLECPHCEFESDPSDFPDLFYEGLEVSEVYNKKPSAGDILVCINPCKMDSGEETLTIKKEYKIKSFRKKEFSITDDYNDTHWFGLDKDDKNTYWKTFFRLK